ncbi:hypothetical protein NOS3756_59520 (plasmid) [Nostoc sp. NIES-3756]|nr:hypothetical protein [Nostoc sp. NIES-3756]BAT56940.1 hypothetical protein NOS3756_59520 [Nostoc sp. NIES-3756]
MSKFWEKYKWAISIVFFISCVGLSVGIRVLQASMPTQVTADEQTQTLR